MSLSYEIFTDAFLSKITEYSFLRLSEENRTQVVDGYMKRAISEFGKVCKYNFSTAGDDIIRQFLLDVPEEDVDEIADIVSEGMVVQWLKPFVYKQDILSNVMNTKDFTRYSPAELVLRIGNAYSKAQKDYTQKIREYSFNHGDLTDLHI